MIQANLWIRITGIIKKIKVKEDKSTLLKLISHGLSIHECASSTYRQSEIT